MPATSQSKDYDPWVDTDDNGITNMLDLYNIAQLFGTSGTPINKTQMLLDLQNRASALEEKQGQVKTVRFYTPNETTTNVNEWKDVVVFTWIPHNTTDNAILRLCFYFQFNGGSGVLGLSVNDVLIREVYFLSKASYQWSKVLEIAENGYWNNLPNQNAYAIRFQMRCTDTPYNPAFVKDVNVLLEVMDGLPPN
jgi:hypothetical protein